REDPPHRLLVQGVGPEAVDRLRREGDQAAAPQQVRGPGDAVGLGVVRIDGQDLGWHGAPSGPRAGAPNEKGRVLFGDPAPAWLSGGTQRRSVTRRTLTSYAPPLRMTSNLVSWMSSSLRFL